METRAGDGPKQGKRQGTATPPNPAAFPGGMPLTGMPGAEALSSVDYEAMARNAARFIEEGGKALAAYMKPREEGRIKPDTPDDLADAIRSIGQVTEYWLSDPQRSLELQSNLGRAYLELVASAGKRLSGEDAAPVIAPDPRDKRFADPDWSKNQFFDFLKQFYLLTAQWAERLVRTAEVDPHTRQKAEFYMRQIMAALAPSKRVRA